MGVITYFNYGWDTLLFRGSVIMPLLLQLERHVGDCATIACSKMSAKKEAARCWGMPREQLLLELGASIRRYSLQANRN